MKKHKFIFILCLAIVLVFTSFGNVSAETSISKGEFVASEPDSQGHFTMSLKIYNAKFNTLQFVLRYDPTKVVPVNHEGGETDKFSSFARKNNDAYELSIVGASIDSVKGLIDFTGFLSPGSFLTTDGLTAIKGYANIGSSGIEIFKFKFKKIGSGAVGIEIASQSTLKPYSKFLPQGAALLDAGELLPISVGFKLPTSLGGDSSITPTKPGSSVDPVESPIITKQERLQKTIALQIGNRGASTDGSLIYIDSENKEVMPYIDESNRTMVPVRFIAEQLGASVHWNDKDKEVTIISGNRTIIMTIGSKSYKINDEIKIMDTAAVIKENWNRTMVPIRFVVEALGKAVEWDGESKLVFITEIDEPWQPNRQVEQEVTEDILLIISS